MRHELCFNGAMEPDWLELARRLQAISQTGLAFTHDPYDRERYEAVRAIAAELLAAGAHAELSDRRADAAHRSGAAGADRARALEAILAAETGYATPKVDVRAAVFRDGRILLVRERSDGGWTLPGGWADVGDSPRLATEREVREESGYEVRAVKLAAVYDRNRHAHTPHTFHIWKLFFLCELLGGAAQSSVETDGVDFFAEQALPPLSLGRVTARQIEHMFEHHRNPERPTTFD